ncbi:MAG: hypothetical protein H7Z16_10210 [Pyrinomonadaceae bacterium]|nr:hypothetical protein [Pyrinomonadaceae bacterium]
MKTLTFADAYGLGLIAKNPKGYSEIHQYLSPAAKKIAEAIVTPNGRSSKDARSAAKELQKRIHSGSR